MNNAPANPMGQSGKKHRRFSHLTAEDVAVLDALAPTAARLFERDLQAQARRDRRRASREQPTGPDALERAHARRASRYSHGAGGGRRRHEDRDADR